MLQSASSWLIPTTYILLTFYLSSTALAQPYNWSITDQSPLIVYAPTFQNDYTATWNNSYSLSTGSGAGYLADVGAGRSSHTSQSAEATATVNFIGTGVYVWGEAYQLSAVIYVDGVSQAFSGGESGFIGKVEGLTHGWHQAVVFVRGYAPVQIEGFTFTTDIESSSPTNSTVDIPLVAFGGGINTTGSWNAQYSSVQDALTMQPTNYTTLSGQSYSETTLTLSPPPNTSLVFVYGMVDPYSTTYFVYVEPNQSTSNGTVPQNQSYKATNDWASGNQILYQAQLVTGVQHSITISLNTTFNAYGNRLGLGSAVYVQVPTSASSGSSGLSKGAIAAIAVCATLVLAIVAFFFFVPYGRRVRKNLTEKISSSKQSRRTSIISQSGGIEPYPMAIPMTLRSTSDSSLIKASVPDRALSPISTSQLDSSGPTTSSPTSPDGLLVSEAQPTILNYQSSIPSDHLQSMVSRREKEESMAALLPHLTNSIGSSSDQGRTVSPTSRRLVQTPLRDVDAGPVYDDTESPILPPEYQPSWRQGRDQT